MTAHGRHHRPPWYRRILARLRARRQAEDIEIAQHDAHMVRVEAHAPPPLAWARHALAARLAAYSEAIAYVPPAAVLPDEAVPGLEHLGEGQYGDWATGQFRAYVDGADQ